MMTIVSLSSHMFLIGLFWQVTKSHASAVEVVVPNDGRFTDTMIEADAPNGLVIDNATSAAPVTEYQSSCRVYVAPSTIPGAGMGIFAGQNFRKGDEVTTGDGVVPLIDMPWHNDVVEFTDQFLWDEYVWSVDSFTGMEEPGHNLEAASFGIGALPNCFFALLNVYDSHAKRDNAAIEPGVDPGSGAFSVFHDRQGFAKKQIKAGEEIFVDYGYGYFEGDREEIFGLIPFLGSYKAADTLLKGFRAVSQRLVDRLSPGHKKSPADYGSHDISVSLYELLKSVIMTWPSRTQGALPASSRDVSHVLDDLGSTMYIHAQRSKRPVDWLEEHGTCMDHLVIRNSAIPHAGRGAFANKFLPKGSIVAPVPLIHIPRREVMNMYDGYITSQPSAPQYRRNASKILHRQLMLNYCFGHRESSLLLCPYGIASALVNHGSSKTKQANAKIVWSNKTTSRPEWFDMPLEAWARKYQAGLAFDYVAFRDIQEGEEILIDYGDEWQAAWDAHVSKWTPKIFPSQTLNMAVDPIEIPTHDEWPWPDVHLWCRSIYRDFQGLPLADGEAFPCRIISKTKDHGTGEIHYNAELRERSYGVKNEPKLKDIDYCYEVFDEILFSLPRDAFIFGNAYDWEEHNRYYGETWSFRHDLRIPDNIMPKMWKDLSLM